MEDFADLSIEVGHLYLRDLARLDDSKWRDFVRSRILSGLASVAPTIKRYYRHKRSVSIVVLIDDYFSDDGSSPDRNDVASAVQEVADDVQQRLDSKFRNRHSWRRPLSIDYISFESSLASSVDRLYNRIFLSDEVSGSWLSNGQDGRPSSSERHGALIGISDIETVGREKGQTGRPHAIHVDVELFSEPSKVRNDLVQRIWSCPILAAWWQLVRLGIFRDEAGLPEMPEGTIALDMSKEVSKSNSCPPFFGKRTLTVLSPEFLEVEMAVRTILGRVRLIDGERRDLRVDKRLPSAAEHLNRIAYVLVPDGVHPYSLDVSTKGSDVSAMYDAFTRWL